MTEELRQALELSKDLDARPSDIERVSRQTSPESAAWAFQQWALRRRARAKFVRADAMLFDRDGLEMASHESVAAYHASQFPADVPVLDLTAGIGADAIAFAARGPVLACEIDPERAALLSHNLGAGIHQGDGREILSQFDHVWLDPMRRGMGRRLQPDDYQPNPWGMRDELAEKGLVGIKLSPLVPDGLLMELGSAVEFVSFQDECREALVWTGRDAPHGVWSVQVESLLRLPRLPEEARVEEASAFVFEGDPAAIRAHALSGFGLPRLGDSPGYLTGPRLIESPWLTAFEVLWQGPLRLPKIQEACRRLDLRIDAVKKRGVDIDPPTLRRQIKSAGSAPTVLIVHATQMRQRAILAKKLGTP